MNREAYIKQCLLDAISALDIAYGQSSTTPIPFNGDYIYPQIAIERIRSVLNVDTLFPPKGIV